MSDSARRDSLCVLASYLRQFLDAQGNLTIIPSQLDRKRHYKIFELCVAAKHNLVMWERLPPDLLCNRDLPRYRDGIYPDIGVDAVSFVGNEIQVAAQAKWYGATSCLSYTNISTFNNTASCHLNVKEKLMVLSEQCRTPSFYKPETYGFHEERMSDEEVNNWCCFALQNFGVTGSIQPAPVENTDSSPKDETKIRSLWPHQVKALETCVTALQEKDRCFVCMPCGTGKSLVIVELAKRYLQNDGEDETVLILVPNCLLQEQMYKYFQDTDLTVSKVGNGFELYENDDPQVIIAINNSVGKIESNIGLLIVDEAHHMDVELLDEGEEDEDEDLCKTERKWACKARELNPRKIALFTATPTNSDNLDYHMKLPEAIEQGLLVDYCLNIPIFNGHGDRKTALAKLILQRPEWTRILAYCNTVEECKIFSEILNSLGIPSVWLSGRYSLQERQTYLHYFTVGWFRVVVSVRTLGEGVDLPCVDTVMFVEPRGGKFDVIQCVGRSLRKCDERGKNLATIVLPCADEEKELRRFLKCMNGCDDRMMKAVKERKAGRIGFSLIGEGGIEIGEIVDVKEYSRLEIGADLEDLWMIKFHVLKSFFEKMNRMPFQLEKYLNISIGSWLATQRQFHRKNKLSPEKIMLLSSLCVDWRPEVKERETAWLKKLQMVKEFNEKFNVIPFGNQEYEGFRVGKWMQHQKENYQLGSLSEQREKLLNEVLPGWIKTQAEKLDDNWLNYAELTINYYQQWNRFPTEETIVSDKNIGKWLQHQRTNYRQGKLETRRQNFLDEKLPGWIWNQNDRNRETWFNNCQLLQEYYMENGRLPYQSYPKLGPWLTVQRKRSRNGELSQEFQRILDIKFPGWCLKSKDRLTWDESYEYLRCFVYENRRFPKRNEKYRESNTGSWAVTQKQNYKNGKLTTEQVRKLESITGWSW